MRKLIMVGTSVLGLGILGAAVLVAPHTGSGDASLLSAVTEEERSGDDVRVGIEQLGFGLMLSENTYWESHGMS